MSSQRQAITGIQGEMMSAYVNSLQKPESFDKHVRKFRSICLMHDVQIGSLTELPGFLRKLMDDRHLAMDFWAFIGKVSNREGGDLSDNQILGVVIEGVTDTEISEVDGGNNRTVENLRAMLAGVDIQGSEPSPVEMAPFPQTEGVPDRGDERRWTDSPDSMDPSSPHRPLMFGRMEEVADHATALPATPSPLLDEALLRLELARLVQQYFDNIDKRISKLEPHPEGEPPTGTIAPSVTRRSLEEPTTAAEMEELRLRRMGRTRLILEPIASPVEEPLEASADSRPMRIPLEHYSPPSRLGAAPTLLVLVLIGAAFGIYHDPSILRHGFAFVVSLFRNNDDAASATNSTTPQSPPTESVPSDQEASRNNEQRQPAAAQPPVESTPSSPSVDTPSHAAELPSPAPTNHVDSGSSRFAERAVAQTGQAIEAGVSSIEAAGAVNVNPSVMNRNLLVSRVPAYPEFAKMSRIEGDVVMQALISKQGTVKRLHVTEGDSRLRSAAEEAVYKWQYRPYVLNGQPVEVATTVTVNFALNR